MKRLYRANNICGPVSVLHWLHQVPNIQYWTSSCSIAIKPNTILIQYVYAIFNVFNVEKKKNTWNELEICPGCDWLHPMTAGRSSKQTCVTQSSGTSGMENEWMNNKKQLFKYVYVLCNWPVSFSSENRKKKNTKNERRRNQWWRSRLALQHHEISCTTKAVQPSPTGSLVSHYNCLLMAGPEPLQSLLRASSAFAHIHLCTHIY